MANEKYEFRWNGNKGGSTGKTDDGLVVTASILPGEKAPYLVKRILLKQHGVLWYSEPVFEFFARESISSMVKVWPLYRF
jgi:hypothetical protein